MLQRRGERVEFAFFPETTVVSFVVTLGDGHTVETGWLVTHPNLAELYWEVTLADPYLSATMRYFTMAKESADAPSPSRNEDTRRADSE